MSELHQRIRFARKSANLSQEALGALCEPPISKAGVSYWEKELPENRTRPKYENLITISKHTGAPLEWLLSDESQLTLEAMRPGIDAEQDQTLKKVIDDFRNASDDGKQMIARIAEHESRYSKS